MEVDDAAVRRQPSGITIEPGAPCTKVHSIETGYQVDVARADVQLGRQEEDVRDSPIRRTAADKRIDAEREQQAPPYGWCHRRRQPAETLRASLRQLRQRSPRDRRFGAA